MRRQIWIWSICVLFILLSGLLFFSIRLHSISPVTERKCQQTLAANGLKSCVKRVLIFSKTGAFRHDSIPDGIVAIKQLAAKHAIQVDASEDASLFTFENLTRYNVVIFLMTSGHILDAEQQHAFEQYIHAGGGYVGIHSASDTEYEWSWYGQLVGAYFKSHPHTTQARVVVEDHQHISTNMLPTPWIHTDEWYNFRTNPRKLVHVLLSVNETSYQGGTMGDHPIAWYHVFEGGRSWYTAMGHTAASYREPLFLAHIWGGIAYAGNFS